MSGNRSRPINHRVTYMSDNQTVSGSLRGEVGSSSTAPPANTVVARHDPSVSRNHAATAAQRSSGSVRYQC